MVFILCCCNFCYHITKPAQIHKTLPGERKAFWTNRQIYFCSSWHKGVYKRCENLNILCFPEDEKSFTFHLQEDFTESDINFLWLWTLAGEGETLHIKGLWSKLVTMKHKNGNAFQRGIPLLLINKSSDEIYTHIYHHILNAYCLLNLQEYPKIKGLHVIYTVFEQKL